MSAVLKRDHAYDDEGPSALHKEKTRIERRDRPRSRRHDRRTVFGKGTVKANQFAMILAGMFPLQSGDGSTWRLASLKTVDLRPQFTRGSRQRSMLREDIFRLRVVNASL